MRFRPIVALPLLLASVCIHAQTAPSHPAPPHPAAAPSPGAPRPVGGVPSPAQANPAGAPMPVQPNPASAPVAPASGAGMTERGMLPVQPAASGVTQRVQNANAHDMDAQGHTVDPHGRPVGQKPAASSTVH